MESKHGLIIENLSCIVCIRGLTEVNFKRPRLDIYSCRYELLNQFIYPNMVIIVAILFLFHKLESTNYLRYREVLMCCVSYN